MYILSARGPLIHDKLVEGTHIKTYTKHPRQDLNKRGTLFFLSRSEYFRFCSARTAWKKKAWIIAFRRAVGGLCLSGEVTLSPSVRDGGSLCTVYVCGGHHARDTNAAVPRELTYPLEKKNTATKRDWE